jgi:hypothetical protein
MGASPAPLSRSSDDVEATCETLAATIGVRDGGFAALTRGVAGPRVVRRFGSPAIAAKHEAPIEHLAASADCTTGGRGLFCLPR